MGNDRGFRRRFVHPDREGGADDFTEEIRFYLEERTSELVEQGLTQEEAERAALDAFGDVEEIRRQAQNEARRANRDWKWGWMMGTVREDLRFALRAFFRRPGFTFVAVLTLGVGIGATTAVFSVVNAALLRSLPFAEAHRLVFVNGTARVDGVEQVRGNSYLEYRDWRDGTASFSHLSAYDAISLSLTGDGEPERVTGEIVSAGYFELLGVEPLMGRTFRSEEDQSPDQSPVAVLSWGLWQQRFGGDPGVLDRAIEINERPFRVVGVMPRGFGGVSLDAGIWVPTMMASVTRTASVLEQRDSRWMGVLGRLAPGRNLEEAQAELSGVALGLQEAFPDAHRDRSARIQPMRDGYMGTTASLLGVLLAAGGILLLVACANVTNLLLVRAADRKREISMRMALGAGRARVVRQLLVESFVLTGLGGLAGVLLAWIGLAVLVPLIPEGVLPTYLTIRPDGRVLAFSAVLLGLVGILSGMAPSLAAGRGSLAQALKSGAGAGRRGRRLGALDYFVVGQVALALTLLVSAGLMVRTFRAQAAVDPGFQASGLVAFRLEVPAERYDAERATAFGRELREALQSLPMVESVTFGSDLPLRGLTSAGIFVVEGDADQQPIRYYRHRVGPEYFSTLGVPMLQGRPLTADDVAQGPRVAVASRALALRVFGDQDPVGRSMLMSRDGPPVRIVGVADDVRFRSLTVDLLDASDSPDLYLPHAQIPVRRMEVAVRTDADMGALLPRIRETVHGLDAQLPLYAISDMETALSRQTAQARFGSSLLGLFSLLALTLALVGIYGVLSFNVGRRAREIAVRMALGATARTVRRSVIVRGVALVGAGILVGSVAALAAGRALSTFLFGVGTADPVTFGIVITVSVCAAVLAAWVPAKRATRANPQSVLTSE